MTSPTSPEIYQPHAPAIVVLAGPNGAGKTTAAPWLVHDALGVREFVNADEIARGLSAFHPETVAVAADRPRPPRTQNGRALRLWARRRRITLSDIRCGCGGLCDSRELCPMRGNVEACHCGATAVVHARGQLGCLHEPGCDGTGPYHGRHDCSKSGEPGAGCFATCAACA